MSKHTIKGFVTYEKSKYEDAPQIDFMSYKPSPSLWPDLVIVSEHSIEVEVPDDFDPRPAQLAALDKKETALKAAFAKAMMELADDRSKLLCIESAVAV